MCHAVTLRVKHYSSALMIYHTGAGKAADLYILLSFVTPRTTGIYLSRFIYSRFI